jgi:aldehyde dehydrogenase (NAD+)
MKGCADQVKRLTLELGGKSANIVFADADLERAAAAAPMAAFGNAGQDCCARSRILVERSAHDKVVELFAEATRKVVVGAPSEDKTEVGTLVSFKQRDRVRDYIEIGLGEGATIVVGGAAPEDAALADGAYLMPTVFDGVSNDMRIAREEIFGPVAAVIRVKDYDEALAVANDTEFGLSSGIVTTSLKHASHFKRHAQAGMVMVNVPTAGVDYHVPFGGRKGSSYGSREQGRYAAEFFTTVKTAYTAP